MGYRVRCCPAVILATLEAEAGELKFKVGLSHRMNSSPA